MLEGLLARSFASGESYQGIRTGAVRMVGLLSRERLGGMLRGPYDADAGHVSINPAPAGRTQVAIAAFTRQRINSTCNVKPVTALPSPRASRSALLDIDLREDAAARLDDPFVEQSAAFNLGAFGFRF